MDTTPLSQTQQKRLQKLPCDGKPRFTVKGSSERVPYSIAYDSIWSEGLVNREQIRRLRALNSLYRIFAKDFITVKQYQQGTVGRRES